MINAVSHPKGRQGLVPYKVVASNAAEAVARRIALEQILAAYADAIEASWTLQAIRARDTAPQAVRTGDYVGHYGPIIVEASGGALSTRRDRVFRFRY
jgi:hypothetical protein